MTHPFRLTAPVVPERDIHEACAKALHALLLKPAKWACYPAGATQLSPQQQARYSSLGLQRGWPDLLIVYRGIYGIELKRRGGQLSKTKIVRTKSGAPRVLAGQEDIFSELLDAGFKGIGIAHSVDEMLWFLDRWGIPTRGRVAA